MGLSIVILMAVFVGLAACTSPEATRSRGGGPGADVGNRTKIVQMHEGSIPFNKTPQIIRTDIPVAARQADQSSRK